LDFADKPLEDPADVLLLPLFQDRRIGLAPASLTG